MTLRYDAHIAKLESTEGCTTQSFFRNLVFLTPRYDAHRKDWHLVGMHTAEFLKNLNISAKSKQIFGKPLACLSGAQMGLINSFNVYNRVLTNNFLKKSLRKKGKLVAINDGKKRSHYLSIYVFILSTFSYIIYIYKKKLFALSEQFYIRFLPHKGK